MKNLKIKFNFLRLAIANFMLRASEIRGMLDGNPNFTSLPVSLIDLGNAIDTLVETVEAYKDKPSLKGDVQAKRVIVENMLIQIAGAVQSCNDLAKINTSGFSVYATPTPVTQVTVQNLRVKTSTVPGFGTAQLRWKKGRGVYLSVIKYTTGNAADPNATWIQAAATTKSTCQIIGLEPGTYTFSVSVIGSSSVSEPLVASPIVVG